MYERTFLMLKPDTLERNLVYDITKMITDHGFTIEAFDLRDVDIDLLSKHYEETMNSVDPALDFKGKMINTFKDRKVIPMIVGGEDAVVATRKLIGSTQPIKADKESIRGKYGKNDSYKEADEENRLINNLIHGSDSLEHASFEINLWFPNNK